MTESAVPDAIQFHKSKGVVRVYKDGVKIGEIRKYKSGFGFFGFVRCGGKRPEYCSIKLEEVQNWIRNTL